MLYSTFGLGHLHRSQAFTHHTQHLRKKLLRGSLLLHIGDLAKKFRTLNHTCVFLIINEGLSAHFDFLLFRFGYIAAAKPDKKQTDRLMMVY